MCTISFSVQNFGYKTQLARLQHYFPQINDGWNRRVRQAMHSFCQCETLHLLCNLLCTMRDMIQELGGREGKFKSENSLTHNKSTNLLSLNVFLFIFTSLLPLPKFSSLSTPKLISGTESRQPVFPLTKFLHEKEKNCRISLRRT